MTSPPDSPDNATPEGGADLAGALSTLAEKGPADCLRDSDLAKRLAQEVADELGVGRVWVTLTFYLLAKLIEKQTNAGVRRFANFMAGKLRYFLRRSPLFDRIEGAIIQRLAKLDGISRSDQELKDIIDGRLSPSDARFTDSLPLDLQAHRRQFQDNKELFEKVEEAVGSIRASSNPQPPLVLPLRPQTDRFVFGARTVDFLGRQDEDAALDHFLEDPRKFCWWLVAGPGGQGKSRLALEFCLKRGVQWVAGFLPPETWDPARWHDWQPERPTLLVCDYAGSRPEALRNIALALYNTRDALAFPVRLLLLERDADAPWRQRFEPGGNDGPAIRDSLHAAPLTLQGLDDDDLWSIVKAFCRQANRPPPERTETLGSLAAIDPERRPLFAHFLADAVAAGRSPRDWDRETLLRDVLQREEDKYWKQASVIEKDKNLLALATMTGGLPVEIALSLDASNQLPDANSFDPFDPRRHEAMTGCPADEMLAPLEPDILGEFFVLTHLRPLHMRRRLEALRQAAWAHAPMNMTKFLDRAAKDFPADVSLFPLCAVANATAEQRYWWSGAIVNVISAIGRTNKLADAHRLWNNLDELASSHPDEAALRDRLCMGAVSLIAYYCNRGQIDSAEQLWQRLHYLEQIHSDQHELRERKALGGFNLLKGQVEAGQLEDARALWDRLQVLAQDHPDQPALREWLATSAFTLMNGFVKAARLNEALCVSNSLRALAQDHPDEPALRHRQGDAALNLINAYAAASEIDRARVLLDGLDALSEEYPDATLRERYAMGALSLITLYGNARRFHEAHQLCSDLDTLAQEHCDELALGEHHGKAAVNLVIAYCNADQIDRARLLCDRLDALAEGHPDKPSLRERQAEGAFSLIHWYCDAGRLKRAHRLYAHLNAIAQEHYDEPALREFQAKAACNLILGYGKAGETAAARGLLDTLENLARAHPHEPELRRFQATGALNLISAYGNAGAIAAASGVWERLTILAANHPNDLTLRGLQAMGAFNLILDYAQAGNFVGARSIWESLTNLACDHPDDKALREWRAKGTLMLRDFAEHRGDPETVQLVDGALAADPVLAATLDALLAAREAPREAPPS